MQRMMRISVPLPWLRSTLYMKSSSVTSLRHITTRGLHQHHRPQNPIKNIRFPTLFAVGTGVLSATFAVVYAKSVGVPLPTEEEVFNWSGTHSANTDKYFAPTSIQELEALVAYAHENGIRLRPVGSAVSPNGIGLSDTGMVNMKNCDKIISIDKEKSQVTVEAGMVVADVLKALAPHGLTLENLASITEQQIAGWTQAGCHGTGATIPPVDEQVISMNIVTPAQGSLTLSPSQDPELFYLARCGLGCYGIVSQVTLQCVPAHKLVEHTFTSNMEEIKRNHAQWLKQHRHLRYMWVPNTDVVVVVTCDPYTEDQKVPATPHIDNAIRTKALRELAVAHLPNDSKTLSEQNANTMSCAAWRDVLYALDPLNPEWIAKVNNAESEYWKLSEGYVIGDSVDILGFECGGQQWVSEVAFDAGTIETPNLKDVEFIERLYKVIQDRQIAAGSPIEQRWTRQSDSIMSPARNMTGNQPTSVFSWVGIIMYLPTDDMEQREKITKAFFDYKRDMLHMAKDYTSREHWAKIEVEDTPERLKAQQTVLKTLYPLDKFHRRRKELDPKNILLNDRIHALLGNE